jgi:hypothetical protein
MRKRILALSVLAVLAACSHDGSQTDGDAATGATYDDLTSTALENPAAYIPAQCYTRTVDAAGTAHNPCFNCHVPGSAPNYVNDGDLQLAYRFAEPALTNRWSNLFKDRGAAVAAISDAAILEYVRGDNYRAADGTLKLAARLATPPKGWDFNHDGRWGGYTPDCHFNFDDEGFDRTPAGGYSGWRAYGYYPFLGTFWPTNGSTDDALIRLPEAFRRDADGNFNLAIYKINLAIVEALLKRTDVGIDPVEEAPLGVDLNQNGVLDRTDSIRYDWAPTAGHYMYYVGQAGQAQARGEVHLASGLYPEGTEFLHSVRYLDLDGGNNIRLSARMKELRYARKTGWLTYADLEGRALEEVKEKVQFPERLRTVLGNVEYGVGNGQGWVFQGFIEQANGELRPQTYEESVYCVGCHSGIGATGDSSFTFPRKLDATQFRRGWYHWTQRGPAGLPDPVRRDGLREYANYLRHNGAGDEFRTNDEVQAHFFNAAGQLRADAEAELASDIGVLLFPSPARALALNKGYKVIVDEQSFRYGRDGHVAPLASSVHRQVDEDQVTGVGTVVNGPGTLAQ